MRDGQAIRAARAARRTEALVVDAHPEWERLARAIRRQVDRAAKVKAPGDIFGFKVGSLTPGIRTKLKYIYSPGQSAYRIHILTS